MSHWQKIRDAANALRSEVCAAYNLNANELLSTEIVIERTLEYLELFRSRENSRSSNLRGALACLEDDVIYFDGSLDTWFQNYCIAHEIGHFRLQHAAVHCDKSDIEDFSAVENADSAAAQVVGYGAGERREREANLFALELLLPCDVVRGAFLAKNLNARQIARKTGLPTKVVFGQISRALLVPSAEAKTKVQRSVELDASQKRAAETEKCPTLVAAGPGTGKTQTLTARISYLLEKGIEPKRILALTFSNRAAEEMRERIAAKHSAEAAQIAIMTFHAFGLDILRAFWKESGLDAKSSLIDKFDALLFLEKNLAAINLEHYQVLSEPTLNLSSILAAISRAKDELCAPDNYQKLGEKMLVEAAENNDAELKIKAEKVIEIARVYRFYQSFLETEKTLDFGDLIFRAVRLLRENDSVKQQICARYDAILVDEFQDVNRACGMLLKEIADCGKNLWAVGDLRQSIYRWRGASPANLRLFAEDFPNAETVSLEVNYRSRPEIVNLFSGFAKQMKAADASIFSDWRAARTFESTENKQIIHLEIADSLETEATNLAEKINFLRGKNYSYKDCAVICRTHSQLNKFAEILTQKGIPVFYLGEFFERSEVRDLLALLDLRFSADGHSLVRVGEFSEYSIPLADSQIIIAEIKRREANFAEILEDETLSEKISETGAKGWKNLRETLRKFPSEMSAWQFLTVYLFVESSFLKQFFAAENVHNQSKLLGIYQLLRLAQTVEAKFGGAGERQIPEFIAHVKKLARFNEDRNYAQIPAAAENLDAVRLLTVHSAKGLEFPAVFLPFLGKGKIPCKKQASTCPNPSGMTAEEACFHDEEEECLFFVAMSRARDLLYLSRSSRYDEKNSSESIFINALAEILPEPHLIKSNVATKKEDAAAKSFPPKTFYSSDLDSYLRCPRDYYYTKICGIKSAENRSIYLKFHSCIYDTIRSMRVMQQNFGGEFSEAAALQKLGEFWQAAEIERHAYAAIYRQSAEEIIRRAFRRFQSNTNDRDVFNASFDLKVAGGAVRILLDDLEIAQTESGKTVIARQYKTGRQPKTKETVKDREVLMFQAIKENFPDAAPVLRKIYLSDETTADESVTETVIKNRIAKYEKAIAGINGGIFPAAPKDADDCPNCPHFLICPSGK